MRRSVDDSDEFWSSKTFYVTYSGYSVFSDFLLHAVSPDITDQPAAGPGYWCVAKAHMDPSLT